MCMLRQHSNLHHATQLPSYRADLALECLLFCFDDQLTDLSITVRPPAFGHAWITVRECIRASFSVENNPACIHYIHIFSVCISQSLQLITFLGITLAVGLSTACDTLFAQVYGSSCRHKLGVMLIRSKISSYLWVRVRVCLRVCVCARACEYVCVSVCVGVCECVCVYAYVRAQTCYWLYISIMRICALIV